MPLRLRVGGAELALLSTVATFGTPLDVTVAELVVETFFPADEATGRWLRDRASTRRPAPPSFRPLSHGRPVPCGQSQAPPPPRTVN